MPDYFSHSILAERIYERLTPTVKEKIKYKTLYLLGAQGPDIFFLYNYKFSKDNLGRALHKRNAEELFSRLLRGNLSYCAGFATHYALDCTLHPAVYAFENDSKNPLTHQKFENDLGLFISKLYCMRRAILPKERVLACTGPVYDSIKLLDGSVTVTGVERCLKRHFAYTRYLFRTKRQSYRCNYDFTRLKDAVGEAADLGVDCVKAVLSGDITGANFKKEFLQR